MACRLNQPLRPVQNFHEVQNSRYYSRSSVIVATFGGGLSTVIAKYLMTLLTPLKTASHFWLGIRVVNRRRSFLIPFLFITGRANCLFRNITTFSPTATLLLKMREKEQQSELNFRFIFQTSKTFSSVNNRHSHTSPASKSRYS